MKMKNRMPDDGKVTVGWFSELESFFTVDYKFTNLTEEEIDNLPEQYWFLKDEPAVQQELREDWLGKAGILSMNLDNGRAIESWEINEPEDDDDDEDEDDE